MRKIPIRLEKLSGFSFHKRAVILAFLCVDLMDLLVHGTSAKIVCYMIEANGHVEVLIPYGLYRRVLRLMRRHRVQDTPDEVVAEAVRAYLRGRVTGR
jgi:hypothetical protein